MRDDLDAIYEYRDVAPGGDTWATISVHRYPSINEHNPESIKWGRLTIDPALGGTPPPRSRPVQVKVHEMGRAAGRELSVEGMLATGLAWHPVRPWVAGLAVRGLRAHPWIADFRRGTVTSYVNVRVVTSLAGQGTPLSWVGDRLAVLLPAETGNDENFVQHTEPIIYEAQGPGEISFSPSLHELERIAAARVAIFDPMTEQSTSLSPPLIVRRLSSAPASDHLILETVAGVGGRQGTFTWQMGLVGVATVGSVQPLPEGARWMMDHRDAIAWYRDDHVHVAMLTGERWAIPARPGPIWWATWYGSTPAVIALQGSAFRMFTMSGEHTVDLPRGVEVSVAPHGRFLKGELLLGCSGPDRRPGSIAVDLDRFKIQVKWARNGSSRKDASTQKSVSLSDVPAHVDLPTGSGQARLTITAAEKDEAGTLLWIRAGQFNGGEPGQGPPPIRRGYRQAVLDLRLHWPADATAAMLHQQIVDMVGAAVDHCGGTVVVAGHSFGATIALYALAHVPRISAAIAHSGCYNRTRTPTGFQFEKRTYWKAPEVYHTFSAMHFTDRLHGPVLIAHGANDPNPNTPPEQAIEFYQTVVAAGGHARLILFPYEGHTFRFRETYEVLAREHLNWLRKVTC